MKKSIFLVYAAGILLCSYACSKSDPTPTVEPPTEETPKDSMYVLTGRKSVLAGADILFTSSSLDSGVLITEKTGVEQDGATRNYVVNGNYFMSLLFAQSSPGPITTYQINADKKLESLGTFQTETMTAYGNVGNEVLLFKNAWQPEEEYTQWYRLDPKTRQIVGSGEINAYKLAGNGGKAFFTDVKKVGDKIFAPFWSIESGKTFKQAYPDSTWVAVYSYPEMKLEKVIRDGRTGSIGAYFTSGMDIDENGDTYVFGTKLGYDNANKYSTVTPVAVMKIKKGTTDYDKSYFLNLSNASGGQYVYKKTYMGKGYFLLTMVPQPYVYATIFYGALVYGGIKFAVVNVYDGSFKWVTGTPDNKAIQSTTGQENYSDLKGSAYVGVYYTEGSVGKSTVYKIDGASAVATAGLTTDGKAAITGVYKVPVNN